MTKLLQGLRDELVRRDYASPAPPLPGFRALEL